MSGTTWARRVAVVAALTAVFAPMATNMVPAHAATRANLGQLASCASQIEANVRASGDVYGACDGLSDSQIAEASGHAVAALAGELAPWAILPDAR